MTEQTEILALDPSSTCTGYAVLRGRTLVEAGKLSGKSYSCALARVMAMRLELIGLLNEYGPQAIVIEMPLEKQYTRQRGKRSGIAVWAGAAWAMWAVSLDWAYAQLIEISPTVFPVSNTLWTRGTDKAGRQAMVAGLFSRYDPSDDPGGDAADAIALGLWWMDRSRPAREARLSLLETERSAT